MAMKRILGMEVKSEGGVMNAERIGLAAGAIWKKLHEKGVTGLPVAEVKKLPGFNAEEAIAGLGWLAREGKLAFKVESKKAIVTLVEEEIFA